MLLHRLHTVTSHIAQYYFTYCTVTSHIAQCYFTYCTLLLHILHNITTRTTQCYFTYCTILLHALHTVTSHIAQCYCTYWTPSLVNSIWQLPRLNFGHYIRLCRGFIQSSQQSSTSNQTTIALSSSLVTNHPTIRTVSPPDMVVNKERTFAPTCTTKTRNVTGGATPFMPNLGASCRSGASQTQRLFYGTHRTATAWAPQTVSMFLRRDKSLAPSAIRTQDYQETTNKHLIELIRKCLSFTNFRTFFQQFMNLSAITCTAATHCTWGLGGAIKSDSTNMLPEEKCASLVSLFIGRTWCTQSEPSSRSFT